MTVKLKLRTDKWNISPSDSSPVVFAPRATRKREWETTGNESASPYMYHSQNYLSTLISPSVLIFSEGTLFVKSKVIIVESWVRARQGYSHTWWGSRAIPWLFSLLIPSFFSFEPCIERKNSVDLRLYDNTFWVLKIQPNAAEGRGGGGTPYDGLYGEVPPKRGIFFRLQVYERVEILLNEVYKWVGKFVIWVCERARNG